MMIGHVRSAKLMQMGTIHSSILPFLALACVLLSVTTVQAEELYVAPAADLVYAFQKTEKPFGDAYGVKIKWSFGSSGMLSTQIQGGLPVDAFASASPDWVDRLQERGLVVERGRKVFAPGRIALCTHKESKLILGKIEDLVTPKIGTISIANPAHAPYGVAAKEAREKASIGEKVKSKIAYGENVLQTQTHIRKGEVEDATISCDRQPGFSHSSKTKIPVQLLSKSPIPKSSKKVYVTKTAEGHKREFRRSYGW
jgi:molybdate transport system substrate-binding protein